MEKEKEGTRPGEKGGSAFERGSGHAQSRPEVVEENFDFYTPEQENICAH